jgi:hypothetical protein
MERDSGRIGVEALNGDSMPDRYGARQNGCRLIHVARDDLSVGCDFIMATESRYGKADCATGLRNFN